MHASLKRLERLLEHHPLGASAALNLAVFSVVYGLFTPAFQTNDDVSMMLRSAGVAKVLEPSEMILFTHVGIGWVLKSLYSLDLSVPWYGLYLVLSLYVAHTTILYAALRRRPDPALLVFYLLHYVVFGAQLLLVLQFTTVASLVSFAGFGLLICEADRAAAEPPTRIRDLVRGPIMAGIVLVVFGCMIRWRAMVMATILFGPLMTWVALRRPIRSSLLRAAPLALAILLGLGAYQLNEAVYRSDPGWGHLRQFNPLRAQFVDYDALEFLPRDERAHVLELVGWTQNDYRMLRNWFFMNEELYNIEAFQRALRMAPPEKPIAVSTALRVAQRVVSTDAGLHALGLLLLLVVSSRVRAGPLAVLLASLLAVAAVVLLLIYSYKAPPPRVVLPLLFFSILPLFFLYERPHRTERLRALTISACVAGLCFQASGSLAAIRERSDQAELANRTLRASIKRLRPNPQTLYVVWGGSLRWESVLPFEDLSYLEPLRTFGLGTAQRSPDGVAMLEHFDIDDLYLALIARRDVRLVARRERDLEAYATYMREHYGLFVESVLELPPPQLPVYRMVRIASDTHAAERARARKRREQRRASRGREDARTGSPR